MATGLAGGIAQGLQSGFGLARQIEQDKAQGEQRTLDRERQSKQDARQTHADELAASHQQLSASRERLGMLASQNAGLLQQYGAADKIPPEALGTYTQDMEAASKAHMGLLDKLAPRVADWRQQAENNASRMKAGELDPRTMAPADLVHTITGSTGQPIENYLPSPDGKPALVKQMANDFRVGMESQNEGLILKSINGLFSRELKAGVGQPSPHGGTILGKQIIKIVPAPADPNNPEDPNAGKVTPVIRVFVREGGGGVGEQQRMASNEEQRYGAPPGATGHYDAPITQNRSSDPNDPVMHISMDEAMNRIGQMETLASAFEDPAMLARAKQGIVEAGDAPNKFLQAFYAVGGKAPTKIESYENIPLSKYGNLRITKNAQGVETKREMLGAPSAGTESAGPLAKKIADIDASELSAADKEKAKRIAYGVEKLPASAEGGALMQKLKQIEQSDLSDSDKVQAKRTVLMGAGAAGLGARESVFTNRILLSANEAAKDLANIARLPIKADTGIFGGRKQGPSLFDAGKEALAQSMTSQEVQSYNTRSAGLQRSMAAIEAAGLAPSGALSHQMEAVQFRAGDSQQTRLEKLAQTRQIVEAGLETTLSNPKLDDGQRKHIASIIDSLHTAIPFTIADIDNLGVLQESDPNATLASVIKQHKLNKPKATPTGGHSATGAGAPKRITTDAEYDALPSGTIFTAPDGTSRRKP